MTKTLAISEARNRLLDLPDELEKKSGMVIVSRRGEKVLAILPWEFYEAIEETIEILGDEVLMAALKKGLGEGKKNRLIPWEKVKREMAL